MGRGIARWQADVSAAYFPLATDCADPDGFRGTLDLWPMGPVSATRIACDGVRYIRTARHLRGERESAVLISVPGRATVTFRQFGRHAVCPPGAMVVERSDAPYEYAHAEADVQWVVKVPRDMLRARIGAAEAQAGLCLDGRAGLGAYFLTALSAAVTHHAEMTGAARSLAGGHLADLLALTLQGDARALDSEASVVRRAHLDRAQAFIRARLKDPGLSTATVAAHCGVSARYLQRLFAAAGDTVAGHIRDCRLARCREALADPACTDTVAVIAYRWGFADQAQFSRAYRARHGESPRDTRARTRSSACR